MRIGDHDYLTQTSVKITLTRRKPAKSTLYELLTCLSTLTLVLRVNTLSIVADEASNTVAYDPNAVSQPSTLQSSSSSFDPNMNDVGGEDSDRSTPLERGNSSQQNSSDVSTEKSPHGDNFVAFFMCILHDFLNRIKSSQTRHFMIQCAVIIVLVPLLSVIYVIFYILLFVGITPKFLLILDTTKCMNVKLSKIEIDKFFLNAHMALSCIGRLDISSPSFSATVDSRMKVSVMTLLRQVFSWKSETHEPALSVHFKEIHVKIMEDKVPASVYVFVDNVRK